MATPKKPTSKKMIKEETVPRGISPTSSGCYIATSGSGKQRRQHKFDTLDEAIRWKTASDARFKTDGRTISLAEWQSQDLAGDLDPLRLRLKPITIGDWLNEYEANLLVVHPDDTTRVTNVRVLRRFFEDQNAMDTYIHALEAKVAERLPNWLHAENYSTTVQSAVLAIARSVWQRAQRHDHTMKLPFVGLKLSTRQVCETDRRGQPRGTFPAGGWTPMVLVAIASLLHPAYRMAFWLMALAGLRGGELAGLRLGDWNSATRDLRVERQRKASPAKGTSVVKTTASRRPVLLCLTLAAMLDSYIARVHPPRPADPEALAAWNGRYVLVGRKGGPMNRASLGHAVKGAGLAVGLTVAAFGTYSPLHHLRVTLGGLLGSLSTGLSGRAVSLYLGHRVAVALGSDPSARVTRTFYSPAIAGEIESLVDRLETWVQTELLPTAGGDLIDLGTFDDGISVGEAARRFTASGVPMNEDDVIGRVQAGELRSTRMRFAGPKEDRMVVVSATDVRVLTARLRRATLASYSASEVADIFGIDHSRVYQMARVGEIEEITVKAQSRISSPGYCLGSLPGGGRRFTKESVDALAQAEAEDIMRRATWLTTTEAAEVVGLSADAIRARADQGPDLVCWRDPRTSHKARLLEPGSVLALKGDLAVVRVPEAAELLGVTQARVRAMLKFGELQPGARRGHIRRSSVLAAIARRDAA